MLWQILHEWGRQVCFSYTVMNAVISNIKKLFKFLSKILFTLSSRSSCLFMPFFACFSLFLSYIARYAPLKNKKTL